MANNNFIKAYVAFINSLSTEGGLIGVLVFLVTLLFVPMVYGLQLTHDAFYLVLGALLTIIKSKVDHDGKDGTS